MKSVLAVVALALVTLVLEDKARQIAGDAQQVYGEAAEQARAARETVSQKVESQPLVAVLVAAVIGFAVSRVFRRL